MSVTKHATDLHILDGSFIAGTWYISQQFCTRNELAGEMAGDPPVEPLCLGGEQIGWGVRDRGV
jgi:hypothetical protein